MAEAKPVLTEAAFEAWLQTLVESWPQVETVALTGSRARGQAKPDSDWDVIVCLEASCYQTHAESWPQQVDKVEQRIAFDPRLRQDAIDLFFMDPTGHLRRWEWLHLRDLLEWLAPDERTVLEEIAGPVEALLQKPEEEALAQIKRACYVSSGQDEDLTLYGLAEALHGDLQGDFSRLYASLDKAQVLYERRKS